MLRMFAMAFKRFQVFYLSFFMLQVLHLDISKVDQDIGHVATVFQMYVPMFHLF
jgi:hypothetical protein